MAQHAPLTHAHLRTPKAAAVAGILFAGLLFAILGLMRMSIPGNPVEPGAWLASKSGTVALALNLIPFAGISFLWFIGVLRDRLGRREDRFFATVFFGSALLFLASLFASAAAIGALLLASAAGPREMVDSPTLHFARAFAYNLVNIYALKMSAVFMISTSTVAIYTAIAPRWIAILGYVLALVLLIGSFYIGWSFAVLPLWVLLLSGQILIDNLRQPADATEDETADVAH
jgi:MFS family permease